VKNKKEQFPWFIFWLVLAFIPIGIFCFFFGIELMREAKVGTDKYRCMGCATPLTPYGSFLARLTGFFMFVVSPVILYFGSIMMWNIFISNWIKKIRSKDKSDLK